jgi:hypothetical protein
MAMNSDYLVQLSDRRLSAARRPVDEESNKSILVHLSDGRLAMGFTGLAKSGSFDTVEFLTDVVMEAVKADFRVAGFVERLPGVATDQWQAQGSLAQVPPPDRRMTFSAFGFGPGRYFGGRPTPGGVLCSNVRRTGDQWETMDEFKTVRHWRVKPDADTSTATLIDRIGSIGSVTEDAAVPLRTLLLEHRPPEAVVGMGVELMRKWARERPSANTIGDQISSIVLPADIRDGWTFDYHTAHPTPTMYEPVFIEATGRMPPFAYQLEITQHEGAYLVQKVGRNERCPCDSGMKYKRCHGDRPTASKGSLL